MKFPKILYSIYIVSFLLFQSCTKDVDFDQIEDASVKTSYIVTFINTSFTAPEILTKLNEEITFSSGFVKPKFDNSSQNYLEKVELTVSVKNTFSRKSVFSIQMFDRIGNLIYTLKPTIEIAPNSNETTIIEIPKEDVHFLYEAKQFSFAFIILPAPTINNPVTIGAFSTLTIKSSLELFLNFRKI